MPRLLFQIVCQRRQQLPGVVVLGLLRGAQLAEGPQIRMQAALVVPLGGIAPVVQGVEPHPADVLDLPEEVILLRLRNAAQEDARMGEYQFALVSSDRESDYARFTALLTTLGMRTSLA